MGFSLYDQLHGLSFMVSNVGVVVVKFGGLRFSATNRWHPSQPSLNCDYDGVATLN